MKSVFKYGTLFTLHRLISPGQAASLQGALSMESSSVHVTLPYHPCLTGSRLREWVPPPHVLSHLPHTPQSEYSQSTLSKIVNNVLRYYTNKNNIKLYSHCRHVRLIGLLPLKINNY